LNKIIARVGASMLLAMMVVPALAQTPPAKKPAAPTCPACKMTLSATKTAKTTVGVQLTKGGKVMYCCSHCKMDPKIVVKAKAKSDTKM